MKKQINQIDNENDLTNSNNVSHIVSFLNKFWNIKAKPKGYDKLRKDYCDFDGMEEQDNKPLNKFFKGFGNDTAGSFGLTEQLNTPNVVYNEVCQGRSPLHSIVSAIFGYAFLCGAKYQEIKYVDSFKSTLEHHEKMLAIIERTEDNEEAIKSYRSEVFSLLKDIKHKLYFDSVVTDHTKLDEFQIKS